MEKYNPKKIEEKWQKIWKNNPELFKADDKSEKEKAYILDMFPYPSGDGLHMGHVESYTATDIISRYSRMKGKNVLHPQGWDAFGLPAENYAIKAKTHPSITTKKAIKTFKEQMGRLGFSYDWSRELNSSDPEYYKWTQWFFLLLYKNGLAYKKKAKANWCPKCQTVLANEQAEGGTCERCETEVIQKDLEQWFFKITDFAEELIKDLDDLDWPKSTKAAQKNWIGKSKGAQFKLPIVIASEAKQSHDGIAASPTAPRNDIFIDVYTTRLDTVYGMTYVVVAPEHPIIKKLKDKIENYSEIEKYIIKAQNKTELERTALQKEKTGVEMKGLKVINPFNNEEIPLYVADYVLGHYGTGAVMAVPAHDERDFEFATKKNLPIKSVIIPERSGFKNWSGEGEETKAFRQLNEEFGKKIQDIIEGKIVYIEDGILINSKEYNEFSSEKAREKMTSWLEKNNLGEKKINYKIRDWLVSRQRYWGAPIPIIYCRKCWENSKSQFPISKQIQNPNGKNFQTAFIDEKEYAIIPVPESDLPVKLPEDVDFNPEGESPLKYSKTFHKVKCPVCGSTEDVFRESDTMDTFVCSSWYYLRYADPKNEKEFASQKNLKKWLPVDLYVGGVEHTVLHLLYSRFFTKVLKKLGYISFDEPFLKLRHQGIILAEDGNKMSKSKGNVTNPDDIIKEFGADSLRLFEMFMGPLEDSKPWNIKGIIGVYRFLEKVWKIQSLVISHQSTDSKIKTLLHKTIKKITEDIENLRFNTAISSLMVLTNEIGKQEKITIADYWLLITLLSPFAPHIAEELWVKLGHHRQGGASKESIFKEKWPEYDPKLIIDEEIELVVQINGKLRDRIKVSADITEEEAKKLVMKSEKIEKFIAGKEIKKIIFVKGKLLNIVV